MADEAYYIPDDAERRFRETVMGVVTGQVEERMSLAWKIFHPVLTHFPMEWRNCTPDLLASGVDCASTPRRPGEGGVSHQHLIVARKARVIAPSSSDAPNRTAAEAVVDTDLRKRIGAAIHDAVCDCLDKGFGYTLRSRDLDAIKDAAMSEVAPALADAKGALSRRNKEYGRASATIGALRGALAKKSDDCRKAEAAAASAYLSGNAAGFAAAKVDDPWAQDEADVQQLIENHRAWTKQAQDEAATLLWLHAEAVWQRDQTLAGDAPELQRATDLVAELRKHVDSLAKVNERQRAELGALKVRLAKDQPWNEAIDWLLNSRHTADPGIQTAFWGMVDGKFTRDQANAGVFVYDTDGNATVEDVQPDTEATEQDEPKKRAETTCASGPTAENPATTPRGVTPAPTTSPREPWRTTTGAATALATQSPIDPTEQGAEATGQAVRSWLKVGDRVEFSTLKPEWRDGTVAGVAPLRVRADDTDNLTTEPAAVRLLPDTEATTGQAGECKPTAGPFTSGAENASQLAVTPATPTEQPGERDAALHEALQEDAEVDALEVAKRWTLDELTGPECHKTGSTSPDGCDGTCSVCTKYDDEPVTPAIPTEPCPSTHTVDDQTYRCALSVPHPHSWHVSNINRIEATWSDDAADPATPTEPRVWRKGDPEPPFNVQILRDGTDDHLPYLCRIPHQLDWWQWFRAPGDRFRAPGGAPWPEATSVLMGSAELTEVVETTPSGIPDSISTSGHPIASRTTGDSRDAT